MLLGQPQWQPLVNYGVTHSVVFGVATIGGFSMAIIYENIYFKALDIIYYYAAGSQRCLDMVQ